MIKKIILMIALLLIGSNLYANNCTKDEIMSMVNKGFSKSEIDSICNQTISDPMCCCETYTEEWYVNPFADTISEHRGPDYNWKKGDSCRSGQTKDFFSGKQWQSSCTDSSRCGR